MASDKTSKPDHHQRDGKGFVNPWPSFHNHGHLDAFKMLFEFDRKKAKSGNPDGLPKILPINKDDMALFSQPKKETDGTDGRHAKVTSTWLGQYVPINA